VDKLRGILTTVIQLKVDKKERNTTLNALCESYGIFMGYDEETYTYRFTFDKEGEKTLLNYVHVDECGKCPRFDSLGRCSLQARGFHSERIHPDTKHWGGCKIYTSYKILLYKEKLKKIEDEAK
jgi:hypothetical protein